MCVLLKAFTVESAGAAEEERRESMAFDWLAGHTYIPSLFPPISPPALGITPPDKDTKRWKGMGTLRLSWRPPAGPFLCSFLITS